MEGTSFITPIEAWGDIGSSNEQKKVTGNGQASMFMDVFRSAIDQVKETQADVENKQYLVATGQIDDVHTLPIAEAKAGLAVDILITLRNKTLEAYNDLMKINV